MKGVAMTEFLATNWLWLVFLVAMLAMHRHGGCGMHGRHHEHDERAGTTETLPAEHGRGTS